MTRLAPALLALCLAAFPVSAQETDAEPKAGVEEGFSLLEEGAKIIMRSMLNEMKPALDDLQLELGTALSEIEPALRDLSEMIDDIRNYDPPEMLPNGDIIIRRRNVPPPPLPPEGEIEL
ncbi:AAA+ family ATPase [Ostreiculturibacter nitratireducens]|uniref:AAA+ family ATPase n=1 Tax=Ostreiculturibacter nitratireducens TaxID=3075226 RepID=UPI0031B5D7C4